MKTFAVTLIMMLAAAGAAHAGLFDKYSINREDLPEQAREMLDEHFPKKRCRWSRPTNIC